MSDVFAGADEVFKVIGCGILILGIVIGAAIVMCAGMIVTGR